MEKYCIKYINKKGLIVRNKEGGPVRENHKGCGAVMGNRRKKTLYVRGSKSG